MARSETKFLKKCNITLKKIKIFTQKLKILQKLPLEHQKIVENWWIGGEFCEFFV